MATSTPSPKPKLPFAWLVPGGIAGGVTLALVVGGFLRVYQLDSLPPGITPGLASAGLEAIKWLTNPGLPPITSATDYAPLWLLLQAASIKLFGSTELALRVWSVLLGTLGVLTTWLWIRSWFGDRVAMISALMLAANPTAITLSRLGSISAVAPLLISLCLWTATRAWRRRQPLDIALAAFVCLVSLGFGPFGWLAVSMVGLLGLATSITHRRALMSNRTQAVTFAVAGSLLALSAIALAVVSPSLAKIIQGYGVATSVGVWSQTAATNLAMLVLPGAGDQNYQHNLAGQPIFNAFFGLMLVAGFLVGLSRVMHLRYQRLLLVLGLALLPAVLSPTGSPNSAHAMAALPALAALAAIGVSYMLEMWYATFPINSAARTAGLSSLVVLIALSLVLGYTQYFRAWSSLAEVRSVHSEGPVRLAANLRSDKTTANRFVIAPATNQQVVAYLANGGPSYIAVAPEALASLPNGAGARKFYLSDIDRAAVTKTLQAKFPGGVWRPHYSLFNQAEIYYTYETSK